MVAPCPSRQQRGVVELPGIPSSRDRPDERVADHGRATAEGCLTCGDVAVLLRAIDAGAGDIRCRTGDGRVELVSVDLVGPVAAGDLVVVHAGVAIGRIEESEG